MDRDAGQRDRAQGVLLGTAAGDALGAGYEFTHPAADSVIEMRGGGSLRWEPGEWTDDTAMAVGVALAAAEHGALHHPAGLDAVARQFVRWWDSRPKDVGYQTSQVLQWRSADAADMRRRAFELDGLTGGNGSLMRTAPVALCYLDDPGNCARAARAVSELTHSDVRAGEACVLWSWAIRHAVLYGNYDGVRGGLAFVDADFWAAVLDEAESGTPADFPKNGWVVHALQTAWWAIAHTESLPAALEAAVRAGGDTDTTAAIAGGLLGARWGASAIPPQWVALLHGYPRLRGDDPVTLTRRIVDRRIAPRTRPDAG
ncbi:ADP-ribosylglycohydrolase family protein [Nocardia africana]